MKKTVLLLFLILLSQFAFSSEFVFSEEGFPTQRIENTEKGKVTSNLVFQNKMLVFTTKFLEEEESPFEIEYYLRSPVNNSLIGVKRYSGTNLVGGNYLYSEETLFLNASDNLVLTSDFEVASDGIITLKNEDGSVNTYSPDGLLIKKENISTVIEYDYDENKNLIFSTQTDTSNTDILISTEYKEEKKFVETFFDKGNIDHKTVYEVEGKKTTMYENGKPLAIVSYYQDNKRVKEVQYL